MAARTATRNRGRRLTPLGQQEEEMFIWTISDAIGVIFWGFVLLLFALYGGLVLAEKIERKLKAWRGRP